MPAALIARMGQQRVGQRQLPYAKVRSIGKGAFGEVFLVRSRDSGDELVMKEISLRGMGDVERASTAREVAVLRKLLHPHVIRYAESFCAGDTLHILTEHAAGGDLAALLHARKTAGRGGVAEPELKRMAWELASALAYCHHELKLLHRDLKPQNVFLSASGKVKLGDFGLSKVLAASAALAVTQCGTPLYMSPELCAGEPYGRAADAWAFGCILLEMATLDPPWAELLARGGMAGGLSALLRHISRAQPDLAALNKAYSPAMCALVSDLLAKEPAARPSLRAVLEKPLMRAAAPAAAPASTSSVPASAAEPAGAGAHAEPECPARRRPLAPIIESPASTPAATKRRSTNDLAERPSLPGRRSPENAAPTAPETRAAAPLGSAQVAASGSSARPLSQPRPPSQPTTKASQARPSTAGGLSNVGGWGGRGFSERVAPTPLRPVTAGKRETPVFIAHHAPFRPLLARAA